MAVGLVVQWLWPDAAGFESHRCCFVVVVVVVVVSSLTVVPREKKQ